MKSFGEIDMWIVTGVIGFALFAFIATFNTLVTNKNQVHNVFGTVDALLAKRYDLVPNLVAAVKGYMQHEKEVLQEITDLRAKAMEGNVSDDQKVVMDNMFSKLFSSVMVAVENYPELKASENFMHLQRTLNELEEQISAGRRAYNAAVTDYNDTVEMMPSCIVAKMFGYKRKEWFEAGKEKRENIITGKLFKK